MRFTMKRTLALVLALMLAMPTFILADGEAMAQDANGQITANELVLNDSPALDDGLLPDDDLLLDGDLVLDGLSPELTQPEDPTGDLELGSQDPAEGGAGEQPLSSRCWPDLCQASSSWRSSRCILSSRCRWTAPYWRKRSGHWMDGGKS